MLKPLKSIEIRKQATLALRTPCDYGAYVPTRENDLAHSLLVPKIRTAAKIPGKN